MPNYGVMPMWRTRVGKLVFVLFLVVFSVSAAPLAAGYGATVDVTLSDTGPGFYDREVINMILYSYEFEMHGRVFSYSTSWYSGSGPSQMYLSIYGLYSFRYVKVYFSNSQGYSFTKTYYQSSFTGSFYYPFPSDDEGGPTSRLKMTWHYVHIGDMGY